MILSRELGKRIWGGSTNMENGGGGVSSDAIAGLLTGYAKESWVDEHYISIDFFSRLFQAHGTENGSEIDVMPNDMDTTITSVESMFGFWTNLYISALGSNGAAPAGISLGMLTDVTISGTPRAGQVLTFDDVTQMWVNGNAQAGATALANLTDVTLTTPQANQILVYNGSAWVNSSVKTINGYSIFGTGDIPASGGGGGNYLPLAGGTMTGTIQSNAYTILSNQNGSAILESSTSLGYISIGYFTSQTDGCFTSIAGKYIIFQAGVSGSIAEKMRITENGNVGIGTTQPGTKLQVNGSLRIFSDFEGSGIFPSTAYLHFTVTNGTSYWDGGGIKSYIASNNAGTNGFPSGLAFFTKAGDGNSSSAASVKMVIDANGNVGINTTNPLFKLHVNGRFYANGDSGIAGTFSADNIYSAGYVTALSDARKKDVMGNVELTVEQVAHAPAVQFLWKDKNRRKDGQQVGTLAQYWQTVLPEVVSDKGGELSLQYGVAALVSAIVTARKVVDHERRIHELEKENERLKEEISQLRLLN